MTRRPPPSEWISPELSNGLGNRLFQFAAAAGLAERLRKPLVFFEPACERAEHGARETLFRMYPGIPMVPAAAAAAAAAAANPLAIREAPNTLYNYQPLEIGEQVRTATNIVVQGFRQSPLYFPLNIQAIMPNWFNALGGTEAMLRLEQELGIQDPDLRRKSVALHVRLGDYKFLPHHQIDLVTYYVNAIRMHVPAGSRLILFSDEPNICKDVFQRFAGECGLEFLVAPVHSDVESLYQMSHCFGGVITANSTFSWWAAFFAHHIGGAWATYPSRYGQGLPMPTEIYPYWATIVSVV